MQYCIIFISISGKLVPHSIIENVESSPRYRQDRFFCIRSFMTAIRSHRRCTLPHTGCKLLCYNFLSINWLSLLVFFSLPARYTWLYCYTLTCVSHVVCDAVYSTSYRSRFSFRVSLSQRALHTTSSFLFSIQILPFSLVNRGTKSTPSRSEIPSLSL